MEVLKTFSLGIGYKKTKDSPMLAEGLNLSLLKGEVVCLLGPNGVGKSTLLKTLAGLLPPLSGKIELDGLDLAKSSETENAKRLAVVLTERVEPGNLEVFEFVSLGRYPYTSGLGTLKSADYDVIRRILRETGLEELENKKVGHLSDGQRQRALVARALAQEPKVLVLDEPTIFLDVAKKKELFFLLRRLSQEGGLAVILSTHDLELATTFSDRLWLFDRHQRIKVGGPEDLQMSGELRRLFEENRAEKQFEDFQQNPANQKPEVLLTGETRLFGWTARLIEKMGFHLSDNPSLPHLKIEVSLQNDLPTWQLKESDKTHSVKDLYRLGQILSDIRRKRLGN